MGAGWFQPICGLEISHDQNILPEHAKDKEGVVFLVDYADSLETQSVVNTRPEPYSQPGQEVELHATSIVHSLPVSPGILEVRLYLFDSLRIQPRNSSMQPTRRFTDTIIERLERRIAESRQLVIYRRRSLCYLKHIIEDSKNRLRSLLSARIRSEPTSEPSPASLSFLPTTESFSASTNSSIWA